ncbi:uncharacterized protein J7T55_013806 [Diaporthe amygdali]|uniref:uncharacterized protein n=1 Tax=Phomopsis amygdali TaxID=1214568 RepID=UPI0022FEE961|nr:uncharacterized protein J7T55_013806 [Diaporthe amygdali]KAJ0119603.1 uncharacterized protein J7T55_013806 [Diaporthe amygdali]
MNVHTSRKTSSTEFVRHIRIMHYIRLMRPPSLDKEQKLKLVLTITTDLGDSFLCPDEPVPISVYLTRNPLENSDETPAICLTPRKAGKSGTSWKSGMRVLKLDLPVPDKIFKRSKKTLPPKGKMPSICIVASDDIVDLPTAADIPFDSKGRIVTLESEFPWRSEDTQQTFESLRRFALTEGDFLRIDERIGESIDRHVWDAGVVTMGLLLNMCQDGTSKHKWDRTPLLRELLRSVTPTHPLNVIELGCGVGILGVGLAAALHQRVSSSWDSEDSAQVPSRVLLTDLPDAEEVAVRNIADEKLARKPVLSGKPSVDTDFESLDWDEGKTGVFGPKATASSWDLIIISDCTYNVDMLSALVKTISELHKLSVDKDGKSSRVMLATKPRHSSEKALFGLMDEDGWKILESASQPLPVLGMEDEVVEIYLFGKDSGQPLDEGQSTTSAPKRRKLR